MSESLIFLIYTIAALFSGYRVISGRSYWLDKKSPLNFIVKIILSLFLGYIIAFFYLIYLIFKLGGFFK